MGICLCPPEWQIRRRQTDKPPDEPQSPMGLYCRNCGAWVAGGFDRSPLAKRLDRLQKHAHQRRAVAEESKDERQARKERRALPFRRAK